MPENLQGPSPTAKKYAPILKLSVLRDRNARDPRSAYEGWRYVQRAIGAGRWPRNDVLALLLERHHLTMPPQVARWLARVFRGEVKRPNGNQGYKTPPVAERTRRNRMMWEVSKALHPTNPDQQRSHFKGWLVKAVKTEYRVLRQEQGKKRGQARDALQTVAKRYGLTESAAGKLMDRKT